MVFVDEKRHLQFVQGYSLIEVFVDVGENGIDLRVGHTQRLIAPVLVMKDLVDSGQHLNQCGLDHGVVYWGAAFGVAVHCLDIAVDLVGADILRVYFIVVPWFAVFKNGKRVETVDLQPEDEFGLELDEFAFIRFVGVKDDLVQLSSVGENKIPRLHPVGLSLDVVSGVAGDEVEHFIGSVHVNVKALWIRRDGMIEREGRPNFIIKAIRIHKNPPHTLRYTIAQETQCFKGG